MSDTAFGLNADQSAELKMALKRDPVTETLRQAASANPIEADEAALEVESGLDFAEPGTWVAEVLA